MTGKSARKTVYLIIFWVLTALVLLYAAFFTYANDFSKISFSLKDGDIYDVNKNLLEQAVIDNETYYLSISVNLTYDNINCLSVNADDIDNDNTELTVNAFNHTENNELIPIFSLPGNKLNNGINYIELPTQDFNYVKFIVTGEDHPVIKAFQFRESARPINYKGEALFMAVVLVVYILLTIIAVKIYTRKRYLPNHMGENARFDPQNYNSKVRLPVFPSKTASAVRTVLFFVMITGSLILAMIDGAYNDRFHEYVLLQLLLCLVIALFIASYIVD